MQKLFSTVYVLALLGTMLSFSLFTGCNRDSTIDDIKPEPPITTPPVANSEPIVGEKMPNPYTIENMTKAYNKVNSTSVQAVTTTDLYVRFLPANEKELKVLEDAGLHLFTVPLDHEVKDISNSYHDKEVPTDKLTWLYSVVPANYVFPQVKHELLSDLHLPKEDDFEVEKAAFEQLGYEVKKAVSTEGWWHRPQGRIKVQDKTTTVPLRRAKVVSVRWFKIGTTYTDDNGNFKIPTSYFNYNWMGYVGKVHLAAFLEDGNRAKIRAMNGFQLYNVALVENIYMGSYYVSSSLEAVNFTITKNTDVNSNACKHWVAAHTHNNLHNYWDYCNMYGIALPPTGLNVWVTNLGKDNSDGAAPMLKQLANSDLVNEFMSKYLQSQNSSAWSLILSALQNYLPDVVMFYNASRLDEYNLAELNFHEFAHTSHYNQIQSPTWWVSVIGYILTNTGVDGCLYGDGTHENAGKSAVMESVAYDIGHIYANNKYPESAEDLENRTSLDNVCDWIPVGLVYDMYDADVDSDGGIDDMVSGIGYGQAVGALSESVNNLEEYKEAVKEYTGHSQDAALDALFQSYGH